MEYEAIRCQERECPYGKQYGQRCILGEVCSDDLAGKGIIHQRHKCPKATKGKLQYVTIILKTA